MFEKPLLWQVLFEESPDDGSILHEILWECNNISMRLLSMQYERSGLGKYLDHASGFTLAAYDVFRHIIVESRMISNKIRATYQGFCRAIVYRQSTGQGRNPRGSANMHLFQRA